MLIYSFGVTIEKYFVYLGNIFLISFLLILQYLFQIWKLKNIYREKLSTFLINTKNFRHDTFPAHNVANINMIESLFSYPELGSFSLGIDALKYDLKNLSIN